jgi:hypothetical protein
MAQANFNIFKQKLPGQFKTEQESWQYQVNPYSSLHGFQTTSLEDLMANATEANKQAIVQDAGNIAGRKYSSINEIFGSDSGLAFNESGHIQTQSSLDNAAKMASDPNMKNVGTAQAPMYVPIGSAADLQLQGKSFAEQMASPSVQKQISEQGLKPVDPAAPVVMQPNEVTGGQTLNIQNPSYSTPLSAAQATVAGTTGPAQTPTKLDTQNQTLIDELSKLYGENVGKGQALASAETTGGVDVMKKNLSNINADILKKTAEYEKLLVDLNGQPIPMGFITGQQAQVRLQAASEIGLLQALALGIQGNLQQAQETAARSVELKYSRIEEEIAMKEAQLNLIQPLLDKEQREKAFQQALALTAQKEAIAEQKAKDAQLQTLAINAAASNIPKNFIDQALATKDPIEATAIIAQADQYQQNRTEIGSSGLKTQYVLRDSGEVQRASDGYAFTSLEDFQLKTGMTLNEANAVGMLGKLAASVSLKGTPTSYQEYQLAKQEGYTGTYNDYQTMDANRKAVRSTTNNYIAGDPYAAKDEARVKQIIAANPGEWGKAAAQIDREFGAGTATKYDALLQAAFAGDIFNNL